MSPEQKPQQSYVELLSWQKAMLLAKRIYRLTVGFPAEVFAGVVLVLLAVGVSASFFPARRATRIDPMEALRSE